MFTMLFGLYFADDLSHPSYYPHYTTKEISARTQFQRVLSICSCRSMSRTLQEIKHKITFLL